MCPAVDARDGESASEHLRVLAQDHGSQVTAVAVPVDSQLVLVDKLQVPQVPATANAGE